MKKKALVSLLLVAVLLTGCFSGALASRATLVVNGAYASATTSPVGQYISWSVSASGGTGIYAYWFNVMRGSTCVHSTGWQASNAVAYQPQVAGNYYVVAYVQDSDWDGMIQATNGGLVQVMGKPALTASGATANKSSATVGESITWTAQASGGTGIYAYWFTVMCGSETVAYSQWQSSNSFTYTPTKSGNHYVVCYVADSDWQGNVQAPGGGLVAVSDPNDLHATSIGVSTTSTTVGSPITWTVGAAGGTGYYAYDFVVYCGSSIVADSGWQAANSYTYTPTAIGDYYVTAYVADSDWTSFPSASSDKVTSVAFAPLTLTVTGPEQVVPATASMFTAVPVGGSGVYAYNYILYGYDSGKAEFTKLWETGYINTDSYPVSCPGEGTYRLTVEVKDSMGSTASATVAMSSVFPAKQLTVELITTLPKSLSLYDGGKLSSAYTISEFSYGYTYNETTNTNLIKLNFSGSKTYDIEGSDNYNVCAIGWKLYDASNALVASGTCYTSPILAGDSFSGATAYVRNIPGGNYKLELQNVTIVHSKQLRQNSAE